MCCVCNIHIQSKRRRAGWLFKKIQATNLVLQISKQSNSRSSSGQLCNSCDCMNCILVYKLKAGLHKVSYSPMQEHLLRALGNSSTLLNREGEILPFFVLVCKRKTSIELDPHGPRLQSLLVFPSSRYFQGSQTDCCCYHNYCWGPSCTSHLTFSHFPDQVKTQILQVLNAVLVSSTT